MTKTFDDIVSNYKDPKPEWEVLINGKNYSTNLELLEFTDSVSNPLKFTIKLSGIDSSDNIPEDAEVIVKRAGGELFRGILKQVEPNNLNNYTFKGTGYAAELEGDIEKQYSSDVSSIVDDIVLNTSVPNGKSFQTNYNLSNSPINVDDFRAKKKQLEEVNRLMGEYSVEWYTTFDGSNPVFNVTNQISFTDGGNPVDTLKTYAPNQSAKMVKQNANRNKGDFDGVVVRGYGDGDDQITATSGSTGKGNRVLIYTDKTILTSSQAQKRADNVLANNSVSWQEIEVEPSNPNKIYGVGQELKIEAEEARLNDTYRVVELYYKFFPGEDEFESKLNLSNKPQTFVDDYKQQKEQTESQTDYSQGNRNTINESVKELADSDNPAKMEFNIPERFTRDTAGNERTAQVRLDYVVDNYRQSFETGTQTTSSVIDSQTEVVGTDVGDFGDISKSQTKKEPRAGNDSDIETNADFTNTDVTNAGGSSVIQETDAENVSGVTVGLADGFVKLTDSNNNAIDLSAGLDHSSGARLHYAFEVDLGFEASSNTTGFVDVRAVEEFGSNYYPGNGGRTHVIAINSGDQVDSINGSIDIPVDTDGLDFEVEVQTRISTFDINVGGAALVVYDEHKHEIPDTEKGSDNVQAYTFAGPEIIDIPTDDEIEIRGELENELEDIGENNKTIQQVEIVGSNNNDGVYNVDFVSEDGGKTQIDIDSTTLDTGDTTGVVQYDIPTDKNSQQDSDELADKNTETMLKDLSAGDLILSEGITEATDVEIIVNGTTVTTKSLSSGPPYKFEDEDITAEVTKPGFNTVEIKPTGGTENGKALVKGNVVVDHKIDGERE